MSRDGSVFGPLEDQEVIKRIADGNIPRRAMIRQSSSEEWYPIESSVFQTAFGASNPYADPKLMIRATGADGAPKGQAGAGVWSAVVVACLYNLAASAFTAAASGAEGAERSGRMIGAFMGRALVALVWVGILQIWKSNRTQERRLVVFVAWHALEFAVLAGLAFL